MEYKALIKRRTVLKGCITKARNIVEHFNPDRDELDYLIIKIDKIKEYEKSFFEVQSNIEICDEVTEDDLKVRDTYDELFDELKLKYQRLLKKFQDRDKINPPFHEQASNGSKVKLKPIEIEPFSGDIKYWPKFIDLYTNLIHNRQDLSDCEKFYYLSSFVKGKAHDIIRGLTTTGENYETALNLLKNRFNNKRVLAIKHTNKLIELQSIKKENAENLSVFIDSINTNLNALKNLEIDHFQFIVSQLITKSLSPNLLKDWEASLSGDDFPDLEELLSFLEDKRRLVESTDTIQNHEKNVSTIRDPISKFKPRFENKASLHANVIDNDSCILCSGHHKLHSCERFQKMNTNQKRRFIIDKRLCYNCLGKNHTSRDCKNPQKCKKCSQNHHTSIHIDKQQEQTPAINATYCALKSQPAKTVLLSTAKVKVKDHWGNLKTARVLLDSASSVCLMTGQYAAKLGLKTRSNNIPISGINNVKAESNSCVVVSIFSMYENFSFNALCHVLPNITGYLPNDYVDCTTWGIPENIFLADPEFNVPDEIDILIGAQYYLSLLKPQQLVHNQNQTILQETRFGFIISGQIPQNFRNTGDTLVSLFISNDQLSSQLKSFWDTEELTERKLTKEEFYCEKHFQENTYRDNQGRFVVSLPRKTDVVLGDSYQNATTRLKRLAQRFQQNQNLRNDYFQVMNEYQELDHMQPSPAEDGTKVETFYLPHHAVFKASSSTTKTRVVFDASAKSTNGNSLNSILATGPVIQQELFSIILRFRTHEFVLTGDIPKMYRQVRINPRDYPLQRILWYDNTGSKIVSYDLKTVTYGLAPSSFLATRCLSEIANQNSVAFPQACQSIKKDFYMDDLLTGCDDKYVLHNLYEDVSSLLKQYGFSLHKCHSNVPELFGDTKTCVKLDKEENVKTLGLFWDPCKDEFVYEIALRHSAKHFSKRIVLSIISSLFDPLGLLAPMIIRYKIFIQELWCSNLQWDDPLPEDLNAKWLLMYEQITLVAKFKIPRLIKISGKIVRLELHGFCDASSTAYGACLFIRSIGQENNIETHLLCSKSRVAPIKQLSIPRLELNAALLLSRLFGKIKNVIGLRFQEIFLWTDSKVVLYWLASLPNRWKTFVANRICEIQELTEGCIWRHVPSRDNPADILSRGCNPSILSASEIWWHGPSFLKGNLKAWPSDTKVEKSITHASLKEEKKQAIDAPMSLNVIKDMELTYHNSDLNKALCIFSYCRRFIHNVKNPQDRLTALLTPDEVNATLHVLIRQTQSMYFSSEIDDLKGRKIVSRGSKLSSLNPYLDHEGLIRVGGRLNFSDLSSEAKNPIILSPDSHLTKLIVKGEHLRLLHGGLQLTHASLRQRFWIVNARILIRSILHKCVTCFRFKGQPQVQLLGQLPRSRVTSSRPFQSTGVDYAGPIFIRHGGRRSRATNNVSVKSYIALFVCLSTKAIHIEVVSDLSTDSFIAALRRFIGRRGIPSQIFSDNGRNFCGADRYIRELYEFLRKDQTQAKIQSFTLEKEIKWSFIPPYSPSWGGLWEAAVKSLKYHLRRVMGNSVLTYEQLTTLLIQVEACLNSRPLYLTSSDPSDPNPLTPGHFLTLAPLTALPDTDRLSVNRNTLSKWQLIQKILRDFWKRWSNDYLHSLQQRNKGKFPSRNLCVGDIVLIKEDNLPPLMWKMGIVVGTYLGKDDLVRVVDIKMNNSVVKRSVSKVILLPIENDNNCDN